MLAGLGARPVRQRAAGAVVAIVIGFGLGGRGAQAGTVELSLTGDPGASFTGECTLYTTAGEERVELAGAVPLQRSFTADGVSCRIAAEGRVVVELAGAGSRSRSATTGGTVHVTLR
jgi:hypothetical protein